MQKKDEKQYNKDSDKAKTGHGIWTKYDDMKKCGGALGTAVENKRWNIKKKCFIAKDVPALLVDQNFRVKNFAVNETSLRSSAIILIYFYDCYILYFFIFIIIFSVISGKLGQLAWRIINIRSRFVM